MHASIPPFIGSLIHRHTHSARHWFIASLNHRRTESLIHWFIGSLLQSFTESLLHCWFTDSLIYRFFSSLVDSLGHCFVALLFFLVHWFTDSLVHRLSGLFTQSCTDSFMSFHWQLNHHFLIRWCMLMHLTTSTAHGFCTSKTFLEAICVFFVTLVTSYFRNFRPGACRALSSRM